MRRKRTRTSVWNDYSSPPIAWNVSILYDVTTRYMHKTVFCVPVTNYDVIQYVDETGYRGKLIVSNGRFGPFSAHTIFSTMKHGVAFLPRRGNLYRKWSFELVARSSVKTITSHKIFAFHYMNPVCLEMDGRSKRPLPWTTIASQKLHAKECNTIYCKYSHSNQQIRQ